MTLCRTLLAGKGAAALARQTVKGFGMFAGGVLSQFGDGVARLAFDDHYIRNRQMRKIVSPPMHVGTELAAAPKDLASSVVQAMSGTACGLFLSSRYRTRA